MLKMQQEAKDYLDKVHGHLDALTGLSLRAGLARHASIWAAINGIFIDMEQIDILVEMLALYVDKRLEAIENDRKISRSVQLSESDS